MKDNLYTCQLRRLVKAVRLMPIVFAIANISFTISVLLKFGNIQIIQTLSGFSLIPCSLLLCATWPRKYKVNYFCFWHTILLIGQCCICIVDLAICIMRKLEVVDFIPSVNNYINCLCAITFTYIIISLITWLVKD